LRMQGGAPLRMQHRHTADAVGKTAL
jgi:hypothetical protein